MILSFKPQFVEPILSGKKKHTIREDSNNRWHPGKYIHMATGVRTKSYKQFASAICMQVDLIFIWPSREQVKISTSYFNVHNLNKNEIEALAINDGFKSSKEFWQWFNKPLIGRLIYFDNVKRIK